MNKQIKILIVCAVTLGMILAVAPVPVIAQGEELELDLWYMPVERPYFPDAKSVAEIMQADLAAIGVTTNLITYEWGEYLDRTEDGEHDMCLLGWSADIAHPDNFVHVLLHGDSAIVGTAMNVAFYNNTEVNTLLTEARETFDQATAEDNYEEACEIIHRDSPWVTVAHSQNLAGYLDDVSGYMTHPTGPGANVYGNVSKTGADVLKIGRGGDSVTLDPAEWTDGQSWKVGRQIFDGLYNLPADSIEPTPALATGYDVSADGLTWTFTLRQGITFHDGTDFNSSAVVFSFERAANWANETSEYYTEGWVPPEAGYYDYIYGGLDLQVEATDTYEVQFTMSKKYSPFLQTLAMGVFAIVSPSYVMNHPGTQTTDRLGLNPVGTGPYAMKEWVVDSSITLETFADYWGPAPKSDELIFEVISEAATRVNRLQAGTIDIVDNIAAADADTVEGTDGVALSSQAGMNVGYLAMNRLRAPFNNDTVIDDPDFEGMDTTHGNLVSRALHYAINRPKIIEEVYQGRAIQAKNPLPPSFWGWNEAVEDYDFDPDHARELLKSLGYSVKEKRAGPETLLAIVSTFGGIAALAILEKKKRQ